jgi:predicted Zn-dependent protease
MRAFYPPMIAEYSECPLYSRLPSESVLNQLGYQLLGGGKKDEAIALFKLNVGRHPNSSNVYDSLAEAYEKNGQLDLAQTNYAQAVQLGSKTKASNLPVYRINLERVSKALKKPDPTPDK